MPLFCNFGYKRTMISPATRPTTRPTIGSLRKIRKTTAPATTALYIDDFHDPTFTRLLRPSNRLLASTRSACVYSNCTYISGLPFGNLARPRIHQSYMLELAESHTRNSQREIHPMVLAAAAAIPSPPASLG